MRGRFLHLLLLPLLLGAAGSSAPPEAALAAGEAKAVREAADGRAKLAAWCLEKKMPVRARWAYEAALRWDPRNAVWKKALEAVDPEAPDADDAKLQREVQDRQKALDKASAKSFLKLGQEALKAKSWGMARRMAAVVQNLEAGAEGLDAVQKALEGKEAAEALKALDAEIAQARESHLLRPAAKGSLEYLLKLPKDHDPGNDRRPVFVFVHGSGGVAKDSAGSFENFRDAGFAVLAPTCESSRMKGDPKVEAEALLGILDRLACEVGLDPGQVFLEGHSGGGNVAYTMIDRYRDRFRGIVPIAANFYIPIRKSPKPDPFPVYVIKGEKDEHNEKLLNAQIAAALEALKKASFTNVKYELIPGMDHSGIHECDGRILEWCQGILSPAKK